MCVCNVSAFVSADLYLILKVYFEKIKIADWKKDRFYTAAQEDQSESMIFRFGFSICQCV